MQGKRSAAKSSSTETRIVANIDILRCSYLKVTDGLLKKEASHSLVTFQRVRPRSCHLMNKLVLQLLPSLYSLSCERKLARHLTGPQCSTLGGRCASPLRRNLVGVITAFILFIIEGTSKAASSVVYPIRSEQFEIGWIPPLSLKEVPTAGDVHKPCPWMLMLCPMWFIAILFSRP